MLGTKFGTSHLNDKHFKLSLSLAQGYSLHSMLFCYASHAKKEAVLLNLKWRKKSSPSGSCFCGDFATHTVTNTLPLSLTLQPCWDLTQMSSCLPGLPFHRRLSSLILWSSFSGLRACLLSSRLCAHSPASALSPPGHCLFIWLRLASFLESCSRT